MLACILFDQRELLCSPLNITNHSIILNKQINLSDDVNFYGFLNVLFFLMKNLYNFFYLSFTYYFFTKLDILLLIKETIQSNTFLTLSICICSQ